MTIIFPNSIEEWYIRDEGIEVPAVFNEDGTVNEEASLKKLDAFKRSSYTTLLSIPGTSDMPDGGEKEILFVGQSTIREAYNVNTQPAAELITQLQNALPHINVTSLPQNLIGVSDNYREPYNNTAISWYEHKLVTAEILQEYNVTVSNMDDLLPWYGIKYIVETGEKYLKLVYRDYNGSIPELPFGLRFFARIYASDGTVHSDIDSYTYTSAEMMQQYCTDNSLVFPAPLEHANDTYLWGVVFNAETLNISVVKAYKFVKIS